MSRLTTPLRTLAAMSGLVLLSSTGFAQGASAPAGAAAEQRIDNRQARQEKRIDQGIESGRLTQREAQRMERQQARIDRAEDRATADGTVTRREAARLEAAQDTSSRRIHRQKHDRQHAPGTGASATRP